MNLKKWRKRNRRAVIRHRRRGTTPTLIMTMPNGAWVKVTRAPSSAKRAAYRTRYAQVFGVWPPDVKIVRELARWS